MKNFFVILCLLLSTNLIYAEQINNCACPKQTKCIDLITSMNNERAALYNVLNLSDDQLKCKDVIDAKRSLELEKIYSRYEQEKYVLSNMCKHKASEDALKKQEKIVNSIEKEIKSVGSKYDKEFNSVLNSEQKSKLRLIRKMQKKEINYCIKQKAFYKRDPKLRQFAEQKVPVNNNLCPEQKKWHMFKIKTFDKSKLNK